MDFLSQNPPRHEQHLSRRLVNVHVPHEVFRNQQLLRILFTPTLLAVVLDYLAFSTFFALSNTSSSTRRLFAFPLLRDIILARYVPEYGRALMLSDSAGRHNALLGVTLHDLDLFLIAQKTPLHQYPTHALAVLSSSTECASGPPFRSPISTIAFPLQDIGNPLASVSRPDHLILRTCRLQSLALAHTRIVLLLQSLIHSSVYPLPPERYPPSIEDRSYASNLWELTFPAPLANRRSASASSAPSQDADKNTPLNVKHKHKHADTAHSRMTSTDYAATVTTTKFSSKPTRRMSIFGHTVKPPPPELVPRALKHYSSWRKSSLMGHRKEPLGGSSRGSVYASSSLGYNERKRLPSTFAPTPTFPSELSTSIPSSPTPSPPSSNASSSRGSSAASPRPPTPDTPPEPSTPQHFNKHPFVIPAGIAPPRTSPPASSSPHSLHHALNWTRAPILQVFVPMSALDITGARICLAHLHDAGLGQALAAGDIVCNLGYVPEREGSDEQLESGDGPRWLIHTGNTLVPYEPSHPPPLPPSLVLQLPSPWYFVHLHPPFAGHAYPAVRFDGALSLCPTPTHVHVALPRLGGPWEIELVESLRGVMSPHSPGGIAKVRTWSWLLRGRAPRAYRYTVCAREEEGILSSVAGVGVHLDSRLEEVNEGGEGKGSAVVVQQPVPPGWGSTWILEGAGTQEGLALLETIAHGRGGERLWELVREKSSEGLVWFRLVGLPGDNGSVNDAESAFDGLVSEFGFRR